MGNEIVIKVRKLLNLANCDGATEGERDNAMRMAHNLLAKHNLSMSHVIEEDTEQREQSTITVSNVMWTATVGKAIAKLFFCEFYITKRKDNIDLNFIGRTSNVVTANEMTKFVIKSIRKESSARSYGDASFSRSFTKGAAGRLYERCVELRKEAEQEETVPSTSTAVSLSSVYRTEEEANRKHMSEKMGLKLTSRMAKNNRIRPSAYNEGAEFGNGISLSRQVGGNKNEVLRLN